MVRDILICRLAIVWTIYCVTSVAEVFPLIRILMTQMGGRD